MYESGTSPCRCSARLLPKYRVIVLRSLREGIDTSNATGRMVAGVLASLAELALDLGLFSALIERRA